MVFVACKYRLTLSASQAVVQNRREALNREIGLLNRNLKKGDFSQFRVVCLDEKHQISSSFSDPVTFYLSRTGKENLSNSASKWARNELDAMPFSSVQKTRFLAGAQASWCATKGERRKTKSAGTAYVNGIGARRLTTELSSFSA